MAYTTTTASVAMKDYIEPAIRETFAEENNTFRAFMDGKTERTNIRGRRIPFRVRQNASYGSIAEGGQLPLAGTPVDVEAKIYYLNQFLTGEMNKEVLEQDDDAALVSFSRRNMEMDTQTFNQRQNLWMFGTGNGSLGVTSDVSGGTTIVFGGDYKARNFIVGSRLNWYSSGNSQRTGGSVSVSTVLTNDGETITVDAVPNNLANTDYATYENSQGNAPHALPYHISDAVTTWLGLSPSTYPTLKATVHDANSNPLTPGMIDLAQAKTRKRAGVNVPLNDFGLIMNSAQEYAYRALGYDTNTVTVNVMADGGKRTLDFGFTQVMHNGMRFRLDDDCAQSDIWGVRYSDWAIEFVKLPGMYTTPGGDKLWQKSGSGSPYDAVQYAVYARYDLVCKDRRRQFRIKNLPYIAGL